MCNCLKQVNEGDWSKYPTAMPYHGKYRVGRFLLTNQFIVSYMSLIHDIIIDEKTLGNYKKINDDNIVSYMEASDILTKKIMQSMRKIIKSPPDGMAIYRKGYDIIAIEIKRKLLG